METIRRSGSGWQALIRKKKFQGQTSKTFSSKAAAKLWANAVVSPLETPAKLDLKPKKLTTNADRVMIVFILIAKKQNLEDT